MFTHWRIFVLGFCRMLQNILSIHVRLTQFTFISTNIYLQCCLPFFAPVKFHTSVLFMLCLQSTDYSFTKHLQNNKLEPHYVILATKTTLKKSVHDHYRMN